MALLAKFLGTHPRNGNRILLKGVSYHLEITPFRGTAPRFGIPKYQLVIKDKDHPFHDTRLTGLFLQKDSPNKYFGDVVRNGKKFRFTLALEKDVVSISRLRVSRKGRA